MLSPALRWRAASTTLVERPFGSAFSPSLCRHSNRIREDPDQYAEDADDPDIAGTL